MKQHFLLVSFLFVIFASGCSQEDVLKSKPASSERRVFTTSFEFDESRTYVEDGYLSRWTEGDQISLFDGNTLNRQYQFDGKTGDNSGTFSIVNNSYGTGDGLTTNYAIYPYSSNVMISGTGIITATLPSVQSYAVNSYGLGDNTMIATTKNKDDTFLNFKNVGGCLKLQLYGDDVTVKTIELKGNNNEKIAGKATIASTYGGSPSVSMADDATETITLECGENGVRIGTSAEAATAFWLVLPPTAFEKGFTVTITDVNGGKFEKATSKQFVVERNVIKPMASIEVKPEVLTDNVIPYLTFSADDIQALKMSKEVVTLEYSVNGSEWKELGINSVLFGGELSDLKIRGKSTEGTCGAQILFHNHVAVSCSGDIRTLIDYENFAEVNTVNARFASLFAGCNNIITAPELPAITLATNCYSNMFAGCTSLTKAPNLPATILAENCYSNMFYGCTNLTNVPNLPAITLATNCYSNMFAGCTSLAKAPDLSATILAYQCCYKMFQGCTNLTEAPNLPATALADYCYAYMFHGCTSLTVSPNLPATALAKSCYQSMFSGCEKLINAPKLPALELETGCYSLMFSGCASLTSAPELPAVILAEYCYFNMFEECVNLTKAPILSVTRMEKSCYSYMFQGCVNLSTAPDLPATTLAEGCYNGMFSECAKLINAPNLPATTLAEGCYMYMFNNCTKLTTSPILKASVLVRECYVGMFSGCTNLKTVTMLAYSVSAYRCLSAWLNRVASTGTFIKNKNSSLPSGMDGIPTKWTVVNYSEE